MNDVPRNRLLRFNDLRQRGVVTNWPRIRRLQEASGFPKGFLLSPGCRVWDEVEIEIWLEKRREAAAKAASTEAA